MQNIFIIFNLCFFDKPFLFHFLLSVGSVSTLLSFLPTASWTLLWSHLHSPALRGWSVYTYNSILSFYPAIKLIKIIL